MTDTSEETAEPQVDTTEETIDQKAEKLNTDPDTLQRAMDLGYDPDFQGDENKTAKTPEQFLELQPIFDDLRKKNREIKRLSDEIEKTKKNDKEVAEQIRKQERERIKKEIAQAHEDGDTQTAIQKTEEMAELDRRQPSQEEEQSGPNQQEFSEAYQQWIKSNRWYENDENLREVADDFANLLMTRDPSIQNRPEELLEEVTKKVKKANPEKFQKPKRRSGVEGEKGGEFKQSKKYSIKNLPEEQQAIAKRVIDATGMSEEEYMKSLGE